ncbi:MAG: ammA [Bacteroidota bacterium]|nr:ammA [Bacteroidota bacterium]
MITADYIKKLAKHYFNEVVSYRRHLHSHPELSFKEFETSSYVSSVLTRYKIPHTTGLVGTGIIAIIQGRNPQSRTVMLRADMDALPIQEENNVVYKSKNPGVMHACGHDVHTASVLGTAVILNDIKAEFEGTIKIMFQPGEEVLPGGSSLMIKAGALTDPQVDIALAQHVFPSMETGKVGFRSGMYMASTDELHITIKGKGGHAAMADDYLNPLVVAAHVITSIEEQFPFSTDDEGVARNIHNQIPTLIAFGKIEGKGATNVIPDTVYLAGTFRTMDEAWRLEVKQKIKTIILTVCEKYGVEAEINIIDGYPCLVNNEALTQSCRAAAIEFLGEACVDELPLRMTAEDFAYVSQVVPSCFYRLGTGNRQKGIVSGVHTSTFDIDENSLEISTGLMAWLTLKNLKS